MLIKSVPTPSPFYTTVEASGDLGDGRLELDLMPIEEPDDWDLGWHGSRGGLELTVLMRWSVNDGIGQTQYSVHYRPGRQSAPLVDRAAAARLMVALHGEGRLTIVDRAGDRPTFRATIGTTET
ncbi:MAG: hypothetical protein JSS99_16345 [Actinobacteria bacterium]|nr:hypothetical protein [Actinomycetota bacterium]